MQVRIYKDLYTSQELENNGFTEYKLSAVPRQLALDSKEKIERDITFKELNKALSKMMNKKVLAKMEYALSFIRHLASYQKRLS